MQFLNPYLLWGLAGIAIPVAIHLLNRFRYRQIDWAAMELLRRALVTRSRRLQIEDLILLVLRSLAFCLLALAFARMTLTRSGARWLGGEADVGVVVAIDTSFSMDCRPGVRSRFDEALDRAREVLGTLEAGHPICMVAMGARARIVLRGIGFDRARVEEALKQLSPRPERIDLEASLEEVQELIDEMKAPIKECYLISDAQATSWERLSDRAARSLEQLAAAARVFLVVTRGQGEDNVSIDDLELAGGTPVAGATARFTATVRNHSRQGRNSILVRLEVNGEVVDERAIDRLGPDGREDVALFARFSKPADARITASLEADAVVTDDQRYLVRRVRDGIKVLCVDGEPGRGLYDGETGYLVAALEAHGRELERSIARVNAVPWTELGDQRLSEYDVVFLANVADVSSEEAADLERFVRTGGGLVVFLGSNVQPGLLEDRLRAGEEPLLPGRLAGAAVQAKEGDGGWPLDAEAIHHPVAVALAGLPSEHLARARVRRFLPIEPSPDARRVLGLRGRPEPLGLERVAGRGRVVLIATSAGRDWSNLVSQPVYPILLQRLVVHLARLPHEEPRLVSGALSLPLEPEVAERAAPAGGGGESVLAVRDPAGEESVAHLVWGPSGGTLELPRPERPGFHALLAPDGALLVSLAVNVDPLESDVKCLGEGELRAALPAAPVRCVSAGEDLASLARSSRLGIELWQELMAAALIAFLLESILARRFSRRAAGGR